jgi:hypothetical protein
MSDTTIKKVEASKGEMGRRYLIAGCVSGF